jgi:glyoxylase-like metal-dependent hydrolase (beta-lactamase superfamily II)
VGTTGTSFDEVAERVWVARHEWFDLNITVVGGDRGLLAVDTHASARAARAVIDDVRRLGVGEVIGVVNTHEHFDHTFGNGTFRTAYGAIPIHAHEAAAAMTVSSGERVKGLYDAEPDDPHADEVRETEIVPADHTFSSAVSLDLGDRAVELVHPGRGHTSGDLVVRIPDIDVVLGGDLVEESGARGHVPGFGSDSFPLEWPHSLDIVLDLLTPATVVVPGHGALVDRDFVEVQRNEIGIVAQTIRDLAGRGVPVDQALDAADWPYPQDALADAVRRGYEHLPVGQRQLPLV